MAALARRSGIWLAAIAVIILLPQIFTSGFALTMLSKVGVLIIFALAYNMLLGQGGMLSFGHAVYFGLAGYFVAHYLTAIGDDALPYFPVSLMPLIGGLVGLAFGIAIGFVSTRRAGTTFAMISLGIAEMVTALTLIVVTFFNGEEGVQTDRWVGPEPFGITFGPDIEVYFLIWIWCLVSVATMYFLTRTPFGRMSNAVRDNPQRVEFIGYNTQRVRWLAFALSAFFAGIAGALHAIHFEHVGFETVGLAQSGLVLFMVYVGGARSFGGPILGAILIALLDSMLSTATEAWPLYYGSVFILIVMFAPGGLAGLILMHGPIWKAGWRQFGPMVRPYALALGAAFVLAIGVIGLIELTYFMSTRPTAETQTVLFWVSLDAATPLPWLAFGAIAAFGIWVSRRTFPAMAASYGEAMSLAQRQAVS